MRWCYLILLLISTTGHAQECFTTSVTAPTPLMGNHGEVFRTADGSIYKVNGSYEYLYAYYPSVIICPTHGKMSVAGKTVGIVAVQATRSVNPASASPGNTRRSAAVVPRSTNAEITVVMRIRGCDYFLADGPRGYYLLQEYGGHDPDTGEGIYTELDGYGMKDVLYENGREGRVWVDDYLLGKSRAFEKLANKCS